jgi:hypothetical protein
MGALHPMRRLKNGAIATTLFAHYCCIPKYLHLGVTHKRMPFALWYRYATIHEFLKHYNIPSSIQHVDILNIIRISSL